MNSFHDERVLLITDEHWIKYVLPCTVYCFLLSISLLLFFLSLSGVFPPFESLSLIIFLAAFLLFSFAHHWFFLWLLSEAADSIIITNCRSIHFHTHLFFYSDMRENSFDKMRTVEAVKHGFLQNVLNYGTLRFQGGDDISLVPHPQSVARAIEQAMGRR
jgi:predicted neutral ceramidase superfamily lipid hydrolase